MAIQITQPFEFESNKPNFERDVINTADTSKFVISNTGNTITINVNSTFNIGDNYDVGHIVWDTNTRKHYRVEYTNNAYCFVPTGPMAKSTSDWSTLSSGNDPYIPHLGEIIVFTDFTQTDGVNVPTYKIGDGVHTAIELPFSASSYATEAGVADRVANPLHIGPHDYDGSSEVTIGLYNGNYNVNP